MRKVKLDKDNTHLKTNKKSASTEGQPRAITNHREERSVGIITSTSN